MTTNKQTIQELQIVEIQSTQIIIHTILGQNGDIPLLAKSSMTTKKIAAIVPENVAIGRFSLQPCFQLWPKTRNYMLEGSIAAFLQMRLQARTNGILQPHVSRAAIVFFFFFSLPTWLSPIDLWSHCCIGYFLTKLVRKVQFTLGVFLRAFSPGKTNFMNLLSPVELTFYSYN